MLRADLHIHSCLSPCGDLDMSPNLIAEALLKNEISVFSITDHNSTKNCRVFQEVANRSGLKFISGIEVTSSEEAHILCYFDNIDDAENFGQIIENTLLQIPLDIDTMGVQAVVNIDEEVECIVENFLGVASSLSTSEILELAGKHNGFVVPAHIDKPIFSLISQLGFLPDEDFFAYELSYGAFRQGRVGEFLLDRPILLGSDAHYIDDIGKAGMLLDDPEEFSFSSIVKSVRSYFFDK